VRISWDIGKDAWELNGAELISEAKPFTLAAIEVSIQGFLNLIPWAQSLPRDEQNGGVAN